MVFLPESSVFSFAALPAAVASSSFRTRLLMLALLSPDVLVKVPVLFVSSWLMQVLHEACGFHAFFSLFFGPCAFSFSLRRRADVARELRLARGERDKGEAPRDPSARGRASLENWRAVNWLTVTCKLN